MGQAVRLGQQDENRHLKRRYILLEFQLAIHCHQHVESSLRTSQKLAVLRALPAEAGYGRNLVAQKLGCKVNRQVFVKKNAHG